MRTNLYFILLALSASVRSLDPSLSLLSDFSGGRYNSCPVLDAPVCGNNDKTYQNSCYLARAGVQKAYDGWCRDMKHQFPPIFQPTAPVAVVDFNAVTADNGYLDRNAQFSTCPCNTTLNPVCGSNGVTYANACRANCKRVPVVAYGECRLFNVDPLPGKICECEYSSINVCATNGITYENSCVAKCFDATVKDNGLCAQTCNCQFFFRPICGENGYNYVNQCELDCAGVAKYSDGLCSAASACNKCHGTIKKVCGKDEKTYDNECYAECAGVKIDHPGQCVIRDRGRCQCPAIYLPVCGKDGVTYSNQCQLNCSGAKLDRFGKCKSDDKNDDKCRDKCYESSYQPVCGTNVVTYYSRQMIGCDSGVSVLYEGQCKPIYVPNCGCSQTLDPVCGVDGRTYFNRCVAQFANVEVYCGGTCELNGNGWKFVTDSRPSNPSPAKNYDGGFYSNRNEQLSFSNNQKLDFSGNSQMFGNMGNSSSSKGDMDDLVNQLLGMLKSGGQGAGNGLNIFQVGSKM